MSKPKVVMVVCPTCKRGFPVEPMRSSMPFCSQRCQTTDLGRWLDEDIGLPSEPSDEDSQQEIPPIVREWRFE